MLPCSVGGKAGSATEVVGEPALRQTLALVKSIPLLNWPERPLAQTSFRAPVGVSGLAPPQRRRTGVNHFAGASDP